MFVGNLPPPTTPDEVGARVLAQERFEEEVVVSTIHNTIFYLNCGLSSPSYHLLNIEFI